MLLILLTVVSLIIARLSISSGFRLGIIDHPNDRKQHTGAIPLAGGISIFLSILAATLILDVPPYSYQMLTIACGVFLVGVFDDIRHINAATRLVIQFGAGILLATFGGIAIHNVGDLLAVGDIHLLALTIPLSALAVAGLSNAYNMIDGIDGLAAATITLPLLVLYFLASQAEHTSANALLVMLVPLAVFLLFNLGPNNRLVPKMFLGDGGSVTLGFLVTASLIYFSQGENATIKPVTALWLVTVPLMDMLATMLRRARDGRKLMRADRSHLHHTLIDRGLSTRQTLAVLTVYATCTAVVGLLLEAIPAYASLACYFLLFIAHCGYVIKSDRSREQLLSNRGSSRLTAQS